MSWFSEALSAPSSDGPVDTGNTMKDFFINTIQGALESGTQALSRTETGQAIEQKVTSSKVNAILSSPITWIAIIAVIGLLLWRGR